MLSVIWSDTIGGANFKYPQNCKGESYGVISTAHWVKLYNGKDEVISPNLAGRAFRGNEEVKIQTQICILQNYNYFCIWLRIKPILNLSIKFYIMETLFKKMELIFSIIFGILAVTCLIAVFCGATHQIIFFIVGAVMSYVFYMTYKLEKEG